MPAYDATILDRLAELETRLRRADAELAITRRRVSELTTAVLVRPAMTREHSVDEDYPRYADGPADLPVVTYDPIEGGYAWTARQSEPSIIARCLYWLPPECPVTIAFDGKQWHVIDGPVMLHGKPYGDTVSTAEWEEQDEYGYTSCDQYATGSGHLIVWSLYTRRTHETSSANPDRSVYRPQTYANGDDVTIGVRNVSSALALTRLLTVVRNAHQDWIVTIDPCEVTC